MNAAPEHEQPPAVTVPAPALSDRNAPDRNAPDRNAKGELIAACRTQNLPDPLFESVSAGPGHAPLFRCTVTVGAREIGRGEGRSKRDAERAASLEALSVLLAEPEDAEAPEFRWPIYADVLSRALLVAHERSEKGTLAEVAGDAALLYRRLLTELGHSGE